MYAHLCLPVVRLAHACDERGGMRGNMVKLAVACPCRTQHSLQVPVAAVKLPKLHLPGSKPTGAVYPAEQAV